MAALEDGLAVGEAIVGYLGDWFDRAGLCCSRDTAARDRVLVFAVAKGQVGVAVSVVVEELVSARADATTVRRLAARVAEQANAGLARR